MVSEQRSSSYRAVLPYGSKAKFDSKMKTDMRQLRRLTAHAPRKNILRRILEFSIWSILSSSIFNAILSSTVTAIVVRKLTQDPKFMASVASIATALAWKEVTDQFTASSFIIDLFNNSQTVYMIAAWAISIVVQTSVNMAQPIVTQRRSSPQIHVYRVSSRS